MHDWTPFLMGVGISRFVSKVIGMIGFSIGIEVEGRVVIEVLLVESHPVQDQILRMIVGLVPNKVVLCYCKASFLHKPLALLLGNFPK